ncbi:hypothetical protein TNIN_322651 [Trichonephila inaurata madagascariensis]|uniref:Uncharacterized protein n=1 Tax=Trichonephila inaurata madagascariensis TaxID=2747483 RepID=A0A8X6Y5W5_9ARAC|nr:hypothetical protein TNIN_322651 [Trichonephila inaurata madagascariensis]
MMMTVILDHPLPFVFWTFTYYFSFSFLSHSLTVIKSLRGVELRLFCRLGFLLEDICTYCSALFPFFPLLSSLVACDGTRQLNKMEKLAAAGIIE